MSAPPAPSAEPPKYTIYINHIPYTSSPKELADVFLQFGKILKSRINSSFRNGTRVSNGFGFIDFAEEASMEAAIHQSGKIQMGKFNLFIAKARPPKQRKKDTIFIKGIPENTTVQMIKDVFAQWHPKDCKIIKFNEKTENGRLGFAFLQFETEQDQADAVKAGRNVTINGGSSKISYAHTSLNQNPSLYRRRRRFGRAPRGPRKPKDNANPPAQ